MKNVAIIGAGLSGLYAANYLAKKGYAVEVFEKNTMPGGRSQVFVESGFKFDMGPSWYWMPEIIDDLFEEIGENREEFYDLSRLENSYKIFWENNESSLIPSNYAQLKQLFNSFENDGGVKLEKFLMEAEKKYTSALPMMEIPGIKITEFFKRKVIASALKQKVFTSVKKDVTSRFESAKARNILKFHHFTL